MGRDSALSFLISVAVGVMGSLDSSMRYGHFSGCCCDVETACRTASHATHMRSQILSSGDDGFNHVARLKTAMALLTQTVTRRETIFVGTTHLA